jgi:predicted Co/Zn/Cd cation transporter (cation efflux family)
MGKNERNEKRKLTATLMNGVALAVFGVTFGAIASKIIAHDGLLPLLGTAALAVLALHLIARATLSGMEEDQ